MTYGFMRAIALLAVASLTACVGPGGIGRDGPSPIEEQLLAEIALERGDYRTAVNKYLYVARSSRDVDYARRATALAWDYGFDAHALSAVERWLELDPEDVAAHGYRVRLATRFGRTDDALESLNMYLGDPAMRRDADYVLLATDLLTAPRQAAELFTRLEADFPESAGIQRSLAELTAQTGDVAAAIGYARKTIALRPDWNSTRAWFARLLLLNDERSSAYEQMAFALEREPGVEYELEFVRLLVAAEEFESAAERLQRVAERYPDEPAVTLVGAALLTEAGRRDEATALYGAMRRAGNCRSECYWNLGALAYDRGDYAEAIELFRNVGPGARLESAVIAESQTRFAMGETDAAIAVLETFATDYPKRRFAVTETKASLQSVAGRHDEAVETSMLALEYQPWNESVWLAHGAILEQAGRMDSALEAFRRAWEIAPQRSTTQNAYGYTLALTTTRYAEAEALIAAALEQDPQNPAIMDSMGWVLFRQGRLAQARVWLEQAWQLMADPEIAAHLVELLWSVDEPEAATALLDEAAALFPDSPALQDVRERVTR
ncbi:MAG: tetratricopeptide repeat protein [Gammaproteobacteria bacterium]|nr:tetratricopeptide repeat protein [Gammaproteobacteria bacterium]NND54781.1 tetratricopeptide repeat protein [Gammaproteobacteria bacterium]